MLVLRRRYCRLFDTMDIGHPTTNERVSHMPIIMTAEPNYLNSTIFSVFSDECGAALRH